jgi:hypothetical protein
MADNRNIKYTATLDDTPFAAASARVASTMTGLKGSFANSASGMRGAMDGVRAQMGETVKSMAGDAAAMGGHFSGLRGALLNTQAGVFGLAGAIAVLGAAKLAASSAAMIEDTMELSRVMGISTNEATVWKIALDDVGATQGELQTAAKGLSRQLKEHEDSMQAMGLKTRDAAGNVRPMNALLTDAFAILGTYKQGVDRAQASNELFGKGLDASSKLLLINISTLDDAIATMKALGLEVGKNATNAWNEFDAASDRAAIGLKGVAYTAGIVLMPIITDLMKAFNSGVPTAVGVTRKAFGSLAQTFHEVKSEVLVLGSAIGAMVATFATSFEGLRASIDMALNRNFSGAAAEMAATGQRMKTIRSAFMADRVAIEGEAAAQIRAIWTPDTERGSGGDSGDKTRGDKGDKDKGKGDCAARVAAPPVEPSFMKYYDAALSEEKRLAAEKDSLREYTKAQELEFWRNLLQNASLVGKDKVAITKKVADLEVEILRDAAKQRQSIDAEVRAGAEQRALEAVELARTEAQTQADLGNITAKQLLEQERTFEEQRTEIRRTYLQARLALIDPDRDPVEHARVSNDIANLEATHQQRLAQIRGSLAKDAQNNPLATIFEGIGQSMQKSIDGIIGRTQTMRTALTSLWQGTRSAITGELSKIIRAKIAAFARERLLMLAGIGGKAAEAGAGAAASQAAIPIVGPAMAMASMAAIMASVLGLSGKVPSARGGFDIPFGSNPMTQLHEQEMVLPKEQADVIRGMAGGGGGGAVNHWNVSTMDARSFRDFLRGGAGDEVLSLLQAKRRGFAF